MLLRNGSGWNRYQTLLAQGQLWRYNGLEIFFKSKTSNPSDAPFPFLLEPILPITSKLAKFFSDERRKDLKTRGTESTGREGKIQRQGFTS